MLRHALEAQGHSVIEARDQPEAVAALQSSRPGVVLSDLRLPEGDGFGVLRAAKELDPELPVIVMTAFGSIQDAVAAMKEGALDFLAKPVDPDHLLLLVERALAQRRMATENMLLKEELAAAPRRAADRRRGCQAEAGDRWRCTARRRPTRRCCSKARAAPARSCSRARCTRSARAPTARSSPSTAPRFPRTCSRPSSSATRRAPSPAPSQRKPGKFELAHRGTLFLDEIGDLPLALQAKILRALEEKRFERVGGTAPLQVDVRVVAATNRNLKAAVAARQFREDLYFRLSVFPITIPPLRERPDDIPMLARYFIERFCRDLEQEAARAVAARRSRSCARYPWPGNVRELQNCIERAVILTEGDTIHAAALNLSFRAPALPPPVDDVEARGRRSICRARWPKRRGGSSAKSSGGRSSRR